MRHPSVLLLSALGLGGCVKAAPPPPAMPQPELVGLYEKTEGAVTLDGTEPSLGAADAPYTVVQFSDFECPYCGRVAPELKALIEESGDVRLLYKHYPLSNICNDNVSREGHTRACGAAMAAECALQQERFWELSWMMFKNSRYLSDGDIRFMAQEVELDMAAFETCLADPQTEAAVRADVAHGSIAGVYGTPSLFLKGATAEEWVYVRGGPRELGTIIDAHRAGASMPPAPAPSPR